MAKVVIAEDEPDIRDLISFTLQFAGYEVFAGNNGEEGYELAKREKPDVGDASRSGRFSSLLTTRLYTRRRAADVRQP